MKNDRSFLKCAVCGNIIEMVEDAGPRVVCCGQKMDLLTPNTTDAAREKHVPVAVRNGSEVEVRIGSEPHPMTEPHHTSWILWAGEGWEQRTTLQSTGEPKALFSVKGDAPISVYAYCNLHGLWATEL